jgi:hypothetical protein
MSKRTVVVEINDYNGDLNDLLSCINNANAFAQMKIDPDA